MIRILFAVVFLTAPAFAQHNHDFHHSEYETWASRKTQTCCNARDCGSVKESEMRQTETGTQILIAGQWCPVLQMHFLIKGRSPNSETAHACVRNYPELPPCERLMCFVGPALH